MNSSLVMLGYDYGILSMQGVKVPLHAKIQSHRIVVGSTNSGKSSAILYWIYKASKLGVSFILPILSRAMNLRELLHILLSLKHVML